MFDPNIDESSDINQPLEQRAGSAHIEAYREGVTMPQPFCRAFKKSASEQSNPLGNELAVLELGHIFP